MSRLRWVLLVLVLLAGVGYAMRGTIAVRVMQNALPRMMAADPIAALEDGIHVTLCGAGSPLPDPNRSGPCVALVAGGKLFVFDAGSGASRNMAAMGRPPGNIEAVLLTHFHSDHIDGLGEIALQSWVGGTRTTPTPLYGPPGVESVAAGFNEAYRIDSGYRVAHHGEKTVPSPGFGFEARSFPAPVAGAAVEVWNEGGVRIQAFRVIHDPVDPAVGYRVDYAGRSVVISGDTRKAAEIARISQGVDLLVHEALAAHLVALMTEAAKEAGRENLAKITHDILDYHATPVEAAETAQEAGVGHLLYYHVVPPLILPGMDVAWLEGTSDAYDGDITLGRDGTTIFLPANSDAIEVSD